jgi:hypothetical protein
VNVGHPPDKLPLSLGDVTPGEDFVRMALAPLEGLHTGGPFFCPETREVWKPLDCLPFPNAEYRRLTREAEVLELMAGRPGFPRNWRVERANGRRFLVRKLAQVISETFESASLTPEQITVVEQAIRVLNSLYWEVGETVLKVAIDPDTAEPFILDLSNAGVRRDALEKSYADDLFLFEQWAWQFSARKALVSLRRSARKVVHSARWSLTPHGLTHRWVYGSHTSPMDDKWPGTSIPNAIYVPADVHATSMYAWVVVPAPLSEDVVARYQLRWGWAPIVYDQIPSSEKENKVR